MITPEEQADKETAEMRPFLEQCSHEDLLHHAIELFRDTVRLRRELDDVQGIIR